MEKEGCRDAGSGQFGGSGCTDFEVNGLGGSEGSRYSKSFHSGVYSTVIRVLHHHSLFKLSLSLSNGTENS